MLQSLAVLFKWKFTRKPALYSIITLSNYHITLVYCQLAIDYCRRSPPGSVLR